MNKLTKTKKNKSGLRVSTVINGKPLINNETKVGKRIDNSNTKVTATGVTSEDVVKIAKMGLSYNLATFFIVAVLLAVLFIS